MAIQFDVSLRRPAIVFDVGSVRYVPTGGGEVYKGDYVVTPKVSAETVLETAGKTMRDDVTVKRVPQYRVSNAAGGITVIIDDKYMQGGS